MNTNQTRIEWVDVTKGIAMIAIVMGHYGIGFINRCVYSWHVPLFFAIAGFFLSRKDATGKFIGKKVKSLLLPFALTAAAVVLVLTIKAFCVGDHSLGTFVLTSVSALYGSGSMQGATTFGITNIGAIWFLQALFWGGLLVRFTNIWVISALAVIAWFSARFVWLPFNLQSGALAALYVYLGQQIYQKTNLLQKTNLPLLILGLASFIGAVALNPPTYFVKNLCSPLSIVAAAFIVYFLLTVFRWLSDIRIIKTVGTAVGTNTLVILCLHSFQLKCFSWGGLWAMTPCAHVPCGRLYLYILFLLTCNAVYFYIGIVIVNSVKSLLKNHIQKGLV